jgi:hypothetical protein
MDSKSALEQFEKWLKMRMRQHHEAFKANGDDTSCDMADALEETLARFEWDGVKAEHERMVEALRAASRCIHNHRAQMSVIAYDLAMPLIKEALGEQQEKKQ